MMSDMIGKAVVVELTAKKRGAGTPNRLDCTAQQINSHGIWVSVSGEQMMLQFIPWRGVAKIGMKMVGGTAIGVPDEIVPLHGTLEVLVSEVLGEVTGLKFTGADEHGVVLDKVLDEATAKLMRVHFPYDGIKSIKVYAEPVAATEPPKKEVEQPAAAAKPAMKETDDDGDPLDDADIAAAGLDDLDESAFDDEEIEPNDGDPLAEEPEEDFESDYEPTNDDA